VSADGDLAGGDERLRAEAPAKINFGLRIVGRRSDGYHELESIFLPLDLCDSVRLDLARGGPRRVSLTLEAVAGAPADAVPGDERNLAVRAARGFLERAGLEATAAIQLRKRIPVAAGLGGGSSDAGAVLRSLSAAFPGALDAAALAALALELGADVPFFLDPRPALVSGIGEHVEPLADWPELALVLVNPGLALATAEVYRAADALGTALTSASPPSTLRARLGALRSDASDGPGALAPLLANDLEPAAVRLCPPIARLRDRLRDVGAVAVGMSGSGPTLFGVFPDVEAAGAALERAAFAAPVWARVAVAAKSG